MAPTTPIGDLATLAEVLDVTEEAAANIVLTAAVQEQSTPESQTAAASITLTPSVIEQVAAAETAAGSIALTPGVVEQAGAADTVSASISLTPNVVEDAGAAGTETALVDLTLTPNVADEQTGATETASATLTLTPNVVEEAGAAATETAAGSISLTPAVTAQGGAAETAAGSIALTAGVVEQAGATETAQASISLSPGVTESATQAAVAPDSGANHQWDWTAGSGTTVTDVNGAEDASWNAVGWQTGAGANDVYGRPDGSDDYGSWSTTAFDFGISGPITIFQWLKPESSISDDRLINSEFSSVNNNLYTGFGSGTAFDWMLTRGGNQQSIRAGDVSNYYGDWIAYACTAGPSNGMVSYLATPGDSYSVDQLGTTSVPPTDSGSWENTVTWGGYQGNSENSFNGGIDVSFIDDTEWTQSELQTFVDDSKGLYS